jgi:hypothetical protein
MTNDEVEYLKRHRTNESSFNFFCDVLEQLSNECGVSKKQYLKVINSDYKKLFDFVNNQCFISILEKRQKN